MVIATQAIAPGSYTIETQIAQLDKSAVAITKGKVLYYDPADDFYKLAPTSGVSVAYAVAVDDAAAADVKVRAAVRGPVTVTANGAIGPHDLVKVSTTTAGQVVAGAQTAVADINAALGSYMGKANNNERDGLVLAAAADADVIWIWLTGGEAR
jgi:hypothetical protein